MSFTSIKVPNKPSDTENNCPADPCTSNIVEPDPSIVSEPVMPADPEYCPSHEPESIPVIS